MVPTRRFHYSNPTVRQVAIESEFEHEREWPLTAFGAIHERVAEWLPSVSQRITATINPSPPAADEREGPPNALVAEVEVRFMSPDGELEAAVRPRKLSLAHVREQGHSYLGWRQLRDAYLRLRDAYAEATGAAAATSMAVDYVNEIAGVALERIPRLLALWPETSQGLQGEAQGFIAGVELQRGQGDLRVTLRGWPRPEPHVYLLLSYSRGLKPPCPLPGMQAALDEGHEAAYELFEELVTDELRGLMGGSQEDEHDGD